MQVKEMRGEFPTMRRLRACVGLIRLVRRPGSSRRGDPRCLAWTESQLSLSTLTLPSVLCPRIWIFRISRAVCGGYDASDAASNIHKNHSPYRRTAAAAAVTQPALHPSRPSSCKRLRNLALSCRQRARVSARFIEQL